MELIENSVCKVTYPKNMRIFCFTSLFQMSAYYLILGILVLYVAKVFHGTDIVTTELAGNFLTLAFTAPLLGGWIAKSFLNSRKTILLGSFIQIIGFALLCIGDFYWFTVSLSLIAIGNGLFNCNLTNMFGYLYEKNDPRKSSGFVIYYIFYNIGVVISEFASGYLVRYFGWNTAFICAALLSVLSFICVFYGINYKQLNVDESNNKTGLKQIIKLFLVLSAAFVISFIFLFSEFVSGVGFILVCLACLFIFLYCIVKDKQNLHCYTAYFILIFLAVIFWLIYWQMSISLPLFIDNIIDKNLFGFNIPAVSFGAFEDLGIVLLGIPIAGILLYFAKKDKEISYGVRFVYGMLATVLALILLICASEDASIVSPWWIILAYLLIAVGELMISPTCLVAVSSLIPKKNSSIMMSIYLVAVGLGAKLGEVIDVSIRCPILSYEGDIKELTFVYHLGFYTYLVIGIFGIIFALVFSFYIKNVMKKAKAN
jgi:proton-dependent oligopeptide transporter, POT family